MVSIFAVALLAVAPNESLALKDLSKEEVQHLYSYLDSCRQKQIKDVHKINASLADLKDELSRIKAASVGANNVKKGKTKALRYKTNTEKRSAIQSKEGEISDISRKLDSYVAGKTLVNLFLEDPLRVNDIGLIDPDFKVCDISPSLTNDKRTVMYCLGGLANLRALDNRKSNASNRFAQIAADRLTDVALSLTFARNEPVHYPASAINSKCDKLCKITSIETIKDGGHIVICETIDDDIAEWMRMEYARLGTPIELAPE